ncbi:cytoskeleton protein RodZ [Vibrio sp. V39_P1S14PM300]|uniref:cytoskeleton protein RodZ n=1 Tax=Vibrio sp. V39_P1S14PM300 TaxID=1938690 RepID=UPI001372B46D|nr:cytoskeleton protein RodZ [Vibrio sp. V39_P1S14PM300]NAX23076.1 cytoskeleton protein RodZ [Vibrio sp. V39_P1S14PM300]
MSTEQESKVEELKVEKSTIEAGSILKQKREELGLSQKQIADRLRLRVSIIENIEDNQFESGQVATFTRGYLRSYARAVGLDEKVVLCAFDDCDGSQPQEQKMQSFSGKAKREKHDSRIMILTWGIFAIIIGISSVWWWQNQTQDTLSFKESQPSVAQPAGDSDGTGNFTTLDGGDAALPGDESDAPQEAAQAVVDAADALPTSEDSETPVSESQPAATMVNPVESVTETESAPHVDATMAKTLNLTFSADCWIQVKDSTGKTLSSGIKKGGQSLALSGEPPYKVILGAPENVSMTFASEPVDLSGYTSGKVARFTLP